MILNSPELFGSPKHTVMDPVHGLIPLFTHEREIIDHPLFLRLRHIKQNDILFYVFPGSTHTRFEHCIGTMYVASNIMKSMIRNYIIYRSIQSFEKKEIDAIQYIFGCLRVAALLHDLGHMPFSHQFEESEVGKKIFKDKDFIKEVWKEENKNYLGELPAELKHEHFSLICAVEILKKIKEGKTIDFAFEIEDVIGIMEKGDAKPSKIFIDHALTLLSKFLDKSWLIKFFVSEEKIALKLQGLLKDIISGEVDADKMDYLLRDSFYSGAKYGEFHIEHLIKNLYLGWHPGFSSTNAWIGIAINEKGKGAFEDFVHSRFRMYLQIYNHKSVVNFKWLIRQAVFEVTSVQTNERDIISWISNPQNFADFTDTLFWELFRNYAKDNPESACSYIINRKKLKYLKSMRTDNIPSFKIDEEKRKLEDEYKIKLIEAESPSKFSKINPVYEKVRMIVFNKMTNKPKLEPISSEFFENGKDIIIKHFFIEPTFKYK